MSESLVILRALPAFAPQGTSSPRKKQKWETSVPQIESCHSDDPSSQGEPHTQTDSLSG